VRSEEVGRYAGHDTPSRPTAWVCQLVGTWNSSNASAGIPKVPSSSRTRGSFLSYMARTITRVGTPSRRAASAGNRTSGSLRARLLRRGPTYRAAVG
jgi:hypothetical protein